MASRRGYGRRGSNRLADMSLPSEERGRRKSTRTSRDPAPALERYESSPAARRRARDGERAMRRTRRRG